MWGRVPQDMGKGCHAHIRSKVCRMGWCSCSLYRAPPRPRGQRSNLVGARRLRVGCAVAVAGMAAGRAKTPGGWPEETVPGAVPVAAAG
jgi:hypothetical protein